MSPFAEYTLLVVGRRIVTDGTRYYIGDQQWVLVSELASEFGAAVYVSYQREVPGTETEGLSKIDESLISVEPNERWQSDPTALGRVASLREDWRTIRNLDGPLVTYTFFPGTYSFLLWPAVARHGTVNAAYFGNEAVDATTGEDRGLLYGNARRLLYSVGQRYVLDNVDVAFVRDPRMRGREGTRIVESKPITQFDASILDIETEVCDDPPLDLLFVGSFREVKGHEYLLRAVASLREDDREYRLRLVGDGPRREAMESLAADLGVADIVTFTGYVEERERLLEEYRRADVFVLPSLSEGFPRVLNEAMAIGLPIVATRVGGIPTVLSNRETALLVEPANVTDLAESIRTVVEDGTLRARIRRAARERATSFFSGSPGQQHLEELEPLVSNEARQRRET